MERIVSIIGKEELSGQEKVIFERTADCQNFLLSPFLPPAPYSGRAGVYVDIETPSPDAQRILNGEFDKVEENTL